MAQQLIGVGTVANDDTGDTLRVGAIKINENFAELYEATANAEVLTSAPAAALPPGVYIVSTATAAFSVTLTETIKGEWRFICVDGSTAVNYVTIGTSGETYNGTAGPLIFDVGYGSIIVASTGVADVFWVEG